MIRRSITVLTVAGLAAAASGQEFSLTLSAPLTGDTFGGETTVTVDVVGDASVGTHMLGGSFALETNSEFVTGMQWNPASWSSFNTDGGYAGDGNYNAVIFGQLVIPNVPPFDQPAPGSELGSLIGSFQVTIAALTCGTINLNLVAQDPFTLEVIDINTGTTFQSSPDTLTLNGASIFVVPAPGTLGLVGAAGLLTIRRRR